MRNGTRNDASETVMLDLVDPEISLILDYIDDRLPAAEVEAVEDRLVHDPAFFARAYPLMVISVTPIDFEEVERLAAELKEDARKAEMIQADVKKAKLTNAEATNVEVTKVEATNVDVAKVEATNVEATEADILEVAKPEPVPVASPVHASSLREEPTDIPRLSQRRRRWSPVAWAVMGTSVAATITVIAIGADPVIQRVAANDAARATLVATTAESKDVKLRNVSLVSLQPHGSLAYPGELPSEGTLERVAEMVAPPSKRLVVFLRGSASIDMTSATGEIQLVTTAGSIILEQHGIYDITSVDTAARTSVFVRKGHATLPNVGGGAEPVIVGPGERGTLFASISAFKDSLPLSSPPQPGAPR
jgi:hypothetical protein